MHSSSATIADYKSVDAAPSKEELLERARLLVPRLRERAAYCEENRSVPAETIADFEEAGFYKIVQPSLYGGYEMCPTVLYEVAMIVASACPSSGWCLSLISVHNWTIALMDPRAAADVWGTNPGARLSSSYAPFGQATSAGEGFMLSGRWPWSSGCDHCQWVSVGARVPGVNGQPDDLKLFLLPRSDYEIEDTWFVAGLKGTGSKDIVVKDVFVPEYRIHSALDSYLQKDPGRETFSGPMFRYSLGTVFAFALASPLLGMAKGAIELFREQIALKRRVFDGGKASADPFNLQRIAEVEAAVRGCDLRLREVFASANEYIDRGESVPLERRVAAKWDAQVVAKTSIEAVDKVFKVSGGSAIRLSNPMQRFFRDAHAASNHAFLNADLGSVNAGGVLFGGENVDPLI